MNYKIEVLAGTEIVIVTHGSVINLEKRSLILNELCQEYNLFKQFKILVDVSNVQQEMSAIEQKIFGKYISSREELMGASIAMLFNEKKSIDEQLTVESAANGLEIKMFSCKDEALSWLKSC